MSHILVCLHGWGGSKESFTELKGALRKTGMEIHTPDLPGFGEEPDPPRPWSVSDYADWVEEYLKRNQIHDQPLSLLGHSHGGRICLVLAARKKLKIQHLYLCAAAGISRPKHAKRLLGLMLAKGGKALLSLPGAKALQPIGKKMLYKLIRVHDYERASDVMRQTLIQVTREDLRPVLPKVTAPTDIFWGIDDQMTPVADGKLMHEAIRGSRLHLFPGVRHRVHRDRAEEIAAVIIQETEEMDRDP